ncbi:siderophore-interacting protein [Vibrio paucivorans]|uniref:Siderophore-interacting protein n=1 Tax=Vibrio paucivorans TaxID=2829489 RepID=A0A9X3CIJ7_9VIBR|nr:siderophore-interacting protein [Vibrio paucivorans]MCW8336497.1 siderophore-interacting protein [Vibrio paucivorans]
MKKPTFRQLTVTSTEQISPNMQRIIFHGEGLSEFPENCEGSYIKLLFNQSGETNLASLEEGARPAMRTYTIRQFSKQQRSITVDFVRHLTQDLQCGFAARWAINAKVGDTINIAGPGAITDINTDVDWFFMVADMTALPALSAKVCALPSDAKGYAVIQVTSLDDIQNLQVPSSLTVTWVTEQDSLIETVRNQPWLDGSVSVWAACEFDSMRAMRTYFRNEKSVERENIYLSSYWKKGVTEDGHKVLKKEDADKHDG